MATYTTFDFKGQRHFVKLNETDDEVYMYLDLWAIDGVKNIRSNHTRKPKGIEINRDELFDYLKNNI